ncbi:MAG TPA: hypothetical protein VFA77_01960 [Candidatus Eisenbacteria bacterium]|jgi:hypothetical protein|nr:hypothetical protein [Candidatus Eisenbacteria bacterium]
MLTRGSTAPNVRQLLDCGDGVCGVAAFDQALQARCHGAQAKAVTSPTRRRSPKAGAAMEIF